MFPPCIRFLKIFIIHNLPLTSSLSPVQSDGAEVEDAGGAAEDVSRQPDLAGDGAEYPATQHRVGNIQGQHSEGNLVVCNIIFID